MNDEINFLSLKIKDFKLALSNCDKKQLSKYIDSFTRELNRLYIIHGMKKLKNTASLSLLRRKIAMINTILSLHR
jgi:ribosomal protein L29